jgi:hypothetical protein
MPVLCTSDRQVWQPGKETYLNYNIISVDSIDLCTRSPWLECHNFIPWTPPQHANPRNSIMRKGAFTSRIMFHKREVRRVNGRRIKEKRATSPLVRTQYWTRRQRLRVLCQQTKAKEPASEDQLICMARFLADLHLPFLNPGQTQAEMSDKQ